MGPGQPLIDAINQAHTTTVKALASAYKAPGVEPGVTGAERRFQQSRAFGPGPIRPYLPPPSSAPKRNTNLQPGGTYRGSTKPRVLPNVSRARNEPRVS